MLLFNYDFLRVAANPARETIAAADAITVTSKVCGAVVSATVSSAGSSAASVSAAVSATVSASVSASVSAVVSGSVSAAALVSASVSAVSPEPASVITPQTSALLEAVSSSSDQPRQYGRVRKSSASLYWKSPRNVKPSTSSSGSRSAGTYLNSMMQWFSSGKLQAT